MKTSHRTAAEDQVRTPLAGRPMLRHDAPSKRKLAGHLDPVIYFVRMPDKAIKIGTTTNLAQRRSQLGVEWRDILAIEPGSYAEEHAWHVRMKAHRVDGHRELFHPHAEVLAAINTIRDRLGVPAI